MSILYVYIYAFGLALCGKHLLKQIWKERVQVHNTDKRGAI